MGRGPQIAQISQMGRVRILGAVRAYGWWSSWVSIPPGCLHAGGVGAGSPGCEATPGYAWERMNNPGGVEALP
jgi:hypothetical protein